MASEAAAAVVAVLMAWVCCAAAGEVPADPAAIRQEGVLTKAQRVLADKRGAAYGWAALAEAWRAAGQTAEAGRCWAQASAAGADSAGLQELAAWRLLGATGAEDRAALAGAMGRLKKHEKTSAWYSVLLLQQAAAEEAGAEALLRLAPAARAVEAFPGALAEQAHLELLAAAGVPRNQAATAVLSRRTYEGLYLLRDLDRALTRESEFLTLAGRGPDAAALLAARNRLRDGYLAAARTLVERLFALRLADMDSPCRALEAKAAALPYLTDPAALAGALGRLGPARGWSELLEPLLANELKFVEAPPALPSTRPAEASMRVKARAATSRPGGRDYQGQVRIELDGLAIACDRARVEVAAPSAARALSGEGHAVIEGIAGFSRACADGFVLAPEAGTIALAGGVRLEGPGGVTKLKACTVSLGGQVGQARSLLDDFAAASDVEARLAMLPEIARAYVEARLAMLPEIARTYADDELPPAAQYLLAMSLLEPRLSWHAAAGPGVRMPEAGKVQDRLVEEWYRPDGPWRDAHTGEGWMVGRLPAAKRKALAREREAAAKAWGEKALAGAYWRLAEPGHADVGRAVRLLQKAGAAPGPLQAPAHRWLEEIRRNNTVITFDVRGGYPRGAAAPVVMDVRNADTVEFVLYRVKTAGQLTAAAGGIGEDFIFRDYGLPLGSAMDGPSAMLREERRLFAARAKQRRDPLAGPAERVGGWTVRVEELKAIPLSWAVVGERGGLWDGDGWFDDDCVEFTDRLRKTYLRAGRRSAWAGGRVVNVPAGLLAADGAYLLAARANGQNAIVPILVEPLSLALRRCRDGVAAAVSDTEGSRPAAGAVIEADEMAGPAVADAEGLAFARVFAGGSRAIVAQKDGRFAIGGFGRVFDGVYGAVWESEWRGSYGWSGRSLAVEPGEALVYPDRHVVAAYTDRPTYRPGQEVNFKLIVRKMPVPAAGGGGAGGFRGEEFEAAGRLELPGRQGPVSYQVLDSKNRVAGVGELRLNEFGTAAGRIQLAAEAPTGEYSLRVRPGSTDLAVPSLFAVKYYRRANFDLAVEPQARTLVDPSRIEVRAEGRYFFGRPVAGGNARVSLSRAGELRPLASGEAQLDAEGNAVLGLDVPAGLAAGEYEAACVLTDASGEAVRKGWPLRIERARQGGGAGLSVPRFAPADKPLAVAAAGPVTVERISKDGKSRREFASSGAAAAVEFGAPGWYRISSGGSSAEVFAYGGTKSPEALERDPEPRGTGAERARRFVDLTSYGGEEDEGSGGEWEEDEPEYRVRAMFEGYEAKAGQPLRLLVYVPAKAARLLLTIEGETVMDCVPLSLRRPAGGAYQVVEVPVRRRHAPNFYLQGRFLWLQEPVQEKDSRELSALKQAQDDEGEDPRWCRVDVTGEPPAAEGLRVSVQPEKQAYRPGEAAYVQVRVADAGGKPVEAEVSLAAVDESVFAFGAERLGRLAGALGGGQPARRYWPKAWRASLGRSASTSRAKIRAHMMAAMRMQEAIAKMAEPGALAALPAGRAAPAADAGQMPAGRIPAAVLRADFRETAAWQPQLTTGADGLLRTSFILPESLTAYRLSAAAITKDTRVGTGRSAVRAGKPLAVQVTLPRFAVEGDRLLATATVYNEAPRARQVRLAWEADGAALEPAAPSTSLRATGQLDGTADIPAGGSVTTAAWLRMDRAGPVKVACTAVDGAESDGEVRRLQVAAMGRAREFALRKPLAGRAEAELPDGFIPRRMTVTVSRSAAAEALCGLEYLVEYPYGCVEQTMSRFAPAVMVRQAALRAGAPLPGKAEAMLPEVLARGLARLYGFQHPDGGWGWWQADASNDAMTAYVVYGLSRCRAAGTAVEDTAILRGCAYLQNRLRDGAMAKDAQTQADAFLALAAAGQAQAGDLTAEAERLLAAGRAPGRALRLRSGRVLATMALACRQAGANGAAERLWAACAAWTGGPFDSAQGGGAVDLALRLRCQSAFGAPLAQCRRTADALLAARTAQRWASTRETAAALEAMIEMLRYTRGGPAPRALSIAVGGQMLLEVPDGAAAAAMVHRVEVPEALLAGGGRPGVLATCDGAEGALLTVTADGVQRLDLAEPSGTEVKIRRRYETLDGAPLARALRAGEVFAVRLAVETGAGRSCFLTEDRRPAGCEFADERLHGPAAAGAAHVEFRDDRVSIFHTEIPAGVHEMTYYLRAQTPGLMHVPPGVAYPMYDEASRGETAGGKVEVVR